MDNTPYLTFFSLREVPFSISPDPEFLFLSRTHRDAIDSLCHGISTRAGFLLLTGEIGTGKTMVCRLLLKKMAGSANLVYIINPSLTGTELISAILDDLEIPYPENATKKTVLGALNSFLLKQPDDTPVVILIDDAQTMSVESLEDIRLLSNLETNKKKLLQIVLVGQPELLELISTNALRQLQQRITIHTQLRVLTLQETRLYILRRLFVAGDHGAVRFTTGAVRLVHQEAGGLPRAINKICDYALMAGFVDDAETITRKHVKKACRELRHLLHPGSARKAPAPISRIAIAAATGILLLSASAAAWLWSGRPWPFSMRQDVLSQGTTLSAPARTDWLSPAPEPTSRQSFAVPTPPISDRTSDVTTEQDARPQTAPAETTVPEQDPGPETDQGLLPAYTIQLASFAKREDAVQEIKRYATMGITAHLQKKGEWHRLLAGVFAHGTEAEAVKTRLNLTDAVIHFTPDARIASPDDFAVSQKERIDEPSS